MKKRFSVNDARLRIKGNVADARQTLINRKQKINVTKVQDARYKIRANKFQITQKNTPFVANITSLKKQVKKQSAKSGVLPGRTISNRLSSTSGIQQPKKVQKSNSDSNVSLSDVSGFISVNNGQRVLMEKVTMHQTGMKIAVRNEFAAPIAPVKKSDGESRVTDNTIKITLKNPTARRNMTPSYSYQHRRSTRQAENSRRLPYSRIKPDDKPYQRPVRVPRNRTPSPPRMDSLKPPMAFRHNQTRNDVPPLPSQLQNNGPRPMNSSESKAFWSRTAGRDSFHKTEEETEHSSPIEGTKILVSNLHRVVVEEDILELFSVLGPVRRARMFDIGEAEVVFVKKDDAIAAFQKYNNRDLDGQPMRMKLLLKESSVKNVKYSWMDEIGDRRHSGKNVEIDLDVLQRAIFKGTSSTSSSRPVVFTVKI